MLISSQSPTSDQLAAFLGPHLNAPYSYPEAGASRHAFPAGYDHDRSRLLLGKGEAVYAAAREAIDGWRMFETGWVQVYPRPAPMEAGTVVAVVFRLFGLYWCNACRIVYTIREADSYGFAYGTLKDHVERGEERFFVTMDAEGRVWYHIEAFSRPGHWLTRLGYPLARAFQRQFVRDSGAAMRSALRQKDTNAPKALI